jgi:hypothetical protein
MKCQWTPLHGALQIPGPQTGTVSHNMALGQLSVSLIVTPFGCTEDWRSCSTLQISASYYGQFTACVHITEYLVSPGEGVHSDGSSTRSWPYSVPLAAGYQCTDRFVTLHKQQGVTCSSRRIWLPSLLTLQACEVNSAISLRVLCYICGRKQNSSACTYMRCYWQQLGTRNW